MEEDNLLILRKIAKKTKKYQRKMAVELGVSLGKLNYCIKALKKKGLIKIENFQKNPNKINYLYILTPKGVAQKTKLTIAALENEGVADENRRKELESLGNFAYKIWDKWGGTSNTP